MWLSTSSLSVVCVLLFILCNFFIPRILSFFFKNKIIKNVRERGELGTKRRDGQFAGQIIKSVIF